MKLSEENRKVIADEMKFSVKNIENENDIGRKLFYYSGNYTMTNRILNLEYDPHLQLIDFVLNSTYAQINNRYIAIKNNQTTVPIHPDLFEKLTIALNNLANGIEKNQDIIPVLERIIAIGYITTGNGYYLLQKGVIKL